MNEGVIHFDLVICVRFQNKTKEKKEKHNNKNKCRNNSSRYCTFLYVSLTLSRASPNVCACEWVFMCIFWISHFSCEYIGRMDGWMNGCRKETSKQEQQQRNKRNINVRLYFILDCEMTGSYISILARRSTAVGVGESFGKQHIFFCYPIFIFAMTFSIWYKHGNINETNDRIYKSFIDAFESSFQKAEQQQWRATMTTKKTIRRSSIFLCVHAKIWWIGVEYANGWVWVKS